MADIDLHNETDPERLRQVAILQDAEIGKLHEVVARLATEVDKLKETKHGQLQQELREVKDFVNRLQHLQFGRSSEKRTTGTRKRRRKRRTPAPQTDLPIVEEVLELDEPDKICPECGDPLDEMGNCSEDSEMVEVVERSFFVKKVRRQKYRCRCGHIEAALGPPKLRGTQRYTPEFALEVATNKYLDHLPLERQARRMARQGLKVSSQTLWDQLDRLGDHIHATYEGIGQWIRGGDVMGMDETPWPHIKKGGANNWQLWVLRGRGAAWYALRDSRSGEVAQELMGDFSGWLVTDALKSYDKAVRRSEKVVRQAGCWSHARRKFVECEDNRPKACGEILDLIGALYEIESRARDPDEGWELGAWRAHLRETESAHILGQIDAWRNRQTALPKSGFGKALNYLKTNWTRLTKFVEHPEVWIDNNATERAIRGPVLGRKNYNGCRSPRGMQVAAMLYTIFETAKICTEDPRDYLRRVVEADIHDEGTVTMPKVFEEVRGDLT